MGRFLAVVSLFLWFRSTADHIIGGELFYDKLDNNRYRFILKIYKLCKSQAEFDGVTGAPDCRLCVFDDQNNLVSIHLMGEPVINLVPSAFSNPCIQTPELMCIEEGYYESELELAPRPGGYRIYYQRCCRNDYVDNLPPGNFGQGATYSVAIPGTEVAASNNSVRFQKFPPLYICNSIGVKLDQSAVDPDGDQLKYSLCAPSDGLDENCPTLGSSGCPPHTDLNFKDIVYREPYSSNYPIPSMPAFSIHPVTGMLAGTPTLTGLYVVGICVEEWKNGVLIDRHSRDFQFTVINCTVPALADLEPTAVCGGKDVKFKNLSYSHSSDPNYYWDFGDNTSQKDTSTLFAPSYFYPDTGYYFVKLKVNRDQPCGDSTVQKIYVQHPQQIFFNKQDVQCIGDQKANFLASGSFHNDAKLTWNFGKEAEPSSAAGNRPGKIRFLSPGIFTVQLALEYQECRVQYEDTVRVMAKPQASILPVPQPLCSPATVTLSGISDFGFPLSYKWMMSDGSIRSGNNIPLKLTPDRYTTTLIVTNSLWCADTSMTQIEFAVDVMPFPGFTAGQTSVGILDPGIRVSSISRLYTCVYDFGDGNTVNRLDHTHTYNAPGDYIITQTVTSKNGCTATAQKKVTVFDEYGFFVPSAFTPDNNGLNDIFQPVLSGVSLYSFKVFSRWGEKVFETDSPQLGWDGLYQGKPCKDGVYVWMISFKNDLSGTFEDHTGIVTLLGER